ncbi:MAG: hypothetical protein JW751_07840 [Polyangiaceae bacterium]|nr:hypothetical protein [Polyangiaceae bacterium]
MKSQHESRASDRHPSGDAKTGKARCAARAGGRPPWLRFSLPATVRCGLGLAFAVKLALLHHADPTVGIERRITGTPTLLVGDESYPGQIPDEKLAELVGRPSG